MKSEILKIGILGCGYECDELIDRVLPPWFSIAKESKHNFVFSFVYGQFKEYVDINGMKEICVPIWYNKYKNEIDYFFTPHPMSEKDMRNTALDPLLKEGCDIVILLDLQDELFSEENIENIIKFIKRDTLTTWFSFSYKNYVFNENTYLEDPFCPPRAFKVNSGSYILTAFYHDNEVYYTDINGGTKDFKMLGSRNIPKNTCFIKHLTWLSDERSKNKVSYQSQRWGSSFCSYRWNYQENKLEFNPEYFQKFNKTLPKVLTD